MEAEAQQLGLAAGQAEDRRHAVIEEVVLAPQQVEPAGVPQQGDVFPTGGGVRPAMGESEAAFAWAWRQDRSDDAL